MYNKIYFKNSEIINNPSHKYLCIFNSRRYNRNTSFSEVYRIYLNSVTLELFVRRILKV